VLGLSEATVRELEFWLTAIGLLGASVAFVVGLRQYLRSEQWKRAEFLAQEIKDFFGQPKVGLALTLIDWGARSLPIRAIRHPEDQTLVFVTRQMQCRALLPHTLVEPLFGSDRESSDAESMADRKSIRRFTQEESIIRDCYDALLDGLERFGSYLESGLVSANDLRPYLAYWINDIAAPTRDGDDADWSASFLLYIHTYRYEGVQTLFAAFGHDIRISTRLFKEFLDAGHSEHRALLMQHPEVAAAMTPKAQRGSNAE